MRRGGFLDWLDSRTGLRAARAHLLDEPLPSGTGWWFVTGSIVLFLLALQFATGVVLTMFYVPSPDFAHDSVRFIMQGVTFGRVVRGLHFFGASFVVVAAVLHMLRVVVFGAYKKPREVTWMTGVVLLLLILGFALTGYLLPWDQTAYWATQVGINMVGTVPLIGDDLARILRGGEMLGALTLTRFFAVHVLFLPAILVSGIVLHLFILRRVGPAGPWADDRSTLKSEAFYPRQVYMDAVVLLGIFVVLAGLAAGVPIPLTDKANPSDTTFVPVPEWYFLFYYELLKYVHGPLEPVATWVLPVIVVAVLLFWPFIDRNPARNPIRRPAAIISGGLFLLVVFSLLGISLKNIYAVPRVDPAIAHGKAVYVQFGCAGCHRIHGEGGAVAPDLSYVGDERPDREWHLRHFRDPQSVVPDSFMPTMFG